MAFPQLPTARRLALLEPPAAPVRLVLDTDTANEIDDQFALVYALLSPERITLEAVYAAPFHNERSSGPSDGMEHPDQLSRGVPQAAEELHRSGLGRRAGSEDRPRPQGLVRVGDEELSRGGLR